MSDAAAAVPAQFYLIRHGETEWSRDGRHTGRTDLALTAHGEDMARKLAPCLQAIAFTRVLTSPRLRARQTCTLAGLGPGAQIVQDLAEWDYGDDEGLSSAQIRAMRPGWDLWHHGCPGGELPAAVAERADRVIAQFGAGEGRIALFSHGHFGRALAARWIGAPVATGQHLALGPASLSILGHEPGHADVAAIVLWNAGPASPQHSP